MFSSSARRVAFVAQPAPVKKCVTPSIFQAVLRPALPYRPSHQRRCSSSKPSSPADGSRGISEGRAVPTTPAHARSEDDKKLSGRTNRRKGKDLAANCTVKARDETVQNLPSVPSTQHVKGKEIAASAFFSLYRPISVTSSFPKSVTDDYFATIFTQKNRKHPRNSEVISTLSSTVHKLETASQQELWNTESDEFRVTITTESHPAENETRHLDNALTEPSIPFPQHILSGQYQPFNPPPPPQPMNTIESLAAGAEALSEMLVPQHRTYKTVLTIEESTDVNGDVTYMAHSGPLIAAVEEPESGPQIKAPPRNAPTSYRERMNIRQERYGESLVNRSREDAAIWAISVKRQRKLKMKKHKYKKLMRRTRNLRRRLDRN